MDSGTQSFAFEQLRTQIIQNYLDARKTETNLSRGFKVVISNTLNSLSRHAKKNFKDMTREDVISFLDSLRKSETVDPTHRWIGTYNLYLRVISTFFKWLYYQTIDPKVRPKPEVLQNLNS